MIKHQQNARHHQHPTKTDICIGTAKHGPTTGFGPRLGCIGGAMLATGTRLMPPEPGSSIRNAGLEKAHTRRHLSQRATRAIQRP